jgi:hypothetical protein
MGGEWDKCFKKTWASNFKFVVFLNKMLLLQILLTKLGSFAKQDFIVVVRESGNSLDINQYYSIDKDITYTAERKNNTNVGFVSLLRR